MTLCWEHRAAGVRADGQWYSLGNDEERGPMHGMCETPDANLEVQRTIKRAELTAFRCLLRRTARMTVHERHLPRTQNAHTRFARSDGTRHHHHLSVEHLFPDNELMIDDDDTWITEADHNSGWDKQFGCPKTCCFPGKSKECAHVQHNGIDSTTCTVVRNTCVPIT